MKPSKDHETVLWNSLFENAWDGMVVLRPDGSVYRVNQRYAGMLGYTLEEMSGLHVWDWDTRFSRKELVEMLHNVDTTGAHFETQQRRKDGTILDMELGNNAALYKGEKLIFCIVRDITARKATEEKLRQNEELLQCIASQVPGALYQYRMAPSGARNFPYFSEGIIELGGLTQQEVSGSGAEPAMSQVLPEDAATVEATIQESARSLSYAHTEFRIRHVNDSVRWIESRSIPHKEADGSILWTGILLDITQRKEAEEKIRAMAITDGLTGIINRQECSRLLENEIARTNRYDTPFAIIMYDLDHFKKINDHFGHNAGDDVLQTVTRLVDANLRSTDIHGRWGGEEFMVVLPQTGLNAAKAVAEALRLAIAEHHFDSIGTVTASFGVAEFAFHENSWSLVQRVDEALYRAKTLGRNRVEV